ncbi:extracellular solute-binding protein [Ruicaihuangia caeni]|uniref:Extracellular solute-binding protein n=1 Tax=Ruicaihuangia caeni TaxID=3042517 RepID=A0AAW6T8B1_9MICO|nr:extracellular solute-binding protein [Klugiella sp. YN-L-19]MDI2097620.1 extracellular solute-binding protein [Klugiella sp. YN-L-19]
MKRKTLTYAAALVAGVFVVTGCSSSPGGDSDGGSVTFAGYGGVSEEAFTNAWYDPFEEETGIRVIPDSPADYAKIQQMVESGQVIWDIAQVGEDIGVKTNGELLTEIDCDVVACDDFDGLFPVEKYGMPALVFSVVLAYNTEMFAGNEPDSWAAFFDVENYPGKRAVFGRDAGGGLQGLLDLALIQDGVPIDELYPLDVDRALAKLDTIKDHLILYNDFGECTTLVATGEAAFGNCYNGRVKIAAEEGQPVGMTWSNQVQYADYLVIPKGAPNTEQAMQLLKFIGSNEHNGSLGQYIAYGPPNPNAEVASDVASDLPTMNDLGGDDRAIKIDGDWWAENLQMVNERWAAWKAE